MKKNCLLILIVLLGINISFAQIEIGPRLGLASYQFTSGGNDGFKLGIYVGGFVDVPLNEKINLQTDLAYVQKGSKEKSNVNSFDYIELSPKAKFFTNPTTKNFYIFIGPGLNFLVREKIERDGFTVDDPGLESFDLSAQIGIGFNFDDNWSLDFKIIDASITNAIKDVEQSTRNLGFNITAAYSFGL